jgi:hypothetical protein
MFMGTYKKKHPSASQHNWGAQFASQHLWMQITHSMLFHDNHRLDLSYLSTLALIIWYSKKQNTIESSTFGTEFVGIAGMQ